jgi:RsmE family RNA methyltransferase
LKFVVDEMDLLFPESSYHRIIAHPPSDTIGVKPIRINQLPRENNGIVKKIVIAVGPEGGWEDEEVLKLVSKGFSLVSLGPRILRTDMAVSVLLGLAHDWTDNE